MAIAISGVGHAVLKVRELDRSLRFYVDVLGLHEVARRDFGEGPMAFLSTGNNHHDLALVEVGPAEQPSVGSRVGLHHLGLRIGDDLGALRAAKDHLDANGVPVHATRDHRVSQGLYVTDPDGHLLELYVDADPEIWRTTPAAVANSDPFAL